MRSVVIKTSGFGAMAGKAEAAQSEQTSTSLRARLLAMVRERGALREKKDAP